MTKQLLKVAALTALLTLAPFVFAANATIQGKTSTGVVKEVQVNASGQPVIAPLTAENQTLGANNYYEKCGPNNVTATGVISSTPGALCGIFVSTSTSCTIQLHDNTSAASGTVFLGTTAAITAPAFYPVKGYFTNGLYFTEGGTCDVTFYTQEAP